MKRAFFLSLFLAVPLLLPAQQVSHVRIVRISMVQGSVSMNQQDGQGWRRALLNAPVSEQTQLRTADGGRVEVQFEDGSTLQLIPGSEVDFTTLNLIRKARHNVVTLLRGSALFSLHPHDSEYFAARFPGGFATAPGGKAWFRVNLGGAVQTSGGADSAVATQAVVHVLNGNLSIQTPDQIYLLKKYDQLTLRASAPAELVKNKAMDSWDQWSGQREQEARVHGWKPHDAPAYGLAELASAGTWSNGCWAPSMGTGWSPYSNGNWFWDPAMGYTWVSGYSWGWLPYHYGSWLTNSTGNWCWSPGANPNWYYTPQPQFIAGSGGGVVIPGRPPIPPPPLHQHFPQTGAVGSLTSIQMQRGRIHQPVLRIPPAHVRRIFLPPAPPRMAMSSLTPAQRAAFSRARQSRVWHMQQVQQAQWQRQQGNQPGMQGSNNQQPANNAPMRSMSTPMRMPASTPRMEPAPRMGGGGRPH